MFTARDIQVIEGLEAVRRRPVMYVGGATVVALVECILGSVVTDTPAPSEVRLILWRDAVFTVAFDGTPLPIHPYAPRVDSVPHPELYRLFMTVGAHASGRALSFGGGVLNALTARLVVSTVHSGGRYRASFCRGALVSLLTKTADDEHLGTN